jgi:hypothetical protein
MQDTITQATKYSISIDAIASYYLPSEADISAL